jgi:streptogramin lyase
MRPVAALLTLALLAGGCSTRERLNPFDPANPDTGGRPTGFVAAAGNQLVRLSWDPVSAAGLAGYQVLRLAPGDSVYRPLTVVLPPTTRTILDAGLLNGADHRYRLYYVLTRGDLATRYAEDVATPGPLRPWVADVAGRDLVLLSADGRHVAQRLPAADDILPAALDVDRTNGRLWIAGAGEVVVYEPWIGAQEVIARGLGDFLESLTLDVSVPGTAWLADASDGYLAHLRPDGSTADPPLLTGMQHPMCVAVDGADGSIWVTDRDGNEVRRYTADGALVVQAAAPAPHRVAVDRATHRAWVTCPEAGRVLVLAADGTALDTLTSLGAPLAVAVDAARRRVWISDYANASVSVFDPAGTRQLALTGLSGPRRLALDPASGEAWVSLGGTGSVARLSPSGAVLQIVTGVGDPWDIAVDDLTNHVGAAAPVPLVRAGTRRAGPAR